MCNMGLSNRVQAVLVGVGAGFGVRIAVWFRCSLSKQMVSGNRV